MGTGDNQQVSSKELKDSSEALFMHAIHILDVDNILSSSTFRLANIKCALHDPLL